MEKPYILIREDMKKDISNTINTYIGKVYIDDIAEYLFKIATNMQGAKDEEIKAIRQKYEEERNASIDSSATTKN